MRTILGTGGRSTRQRFVGWLLVALLLLALAFTLLARIGGLVASVAAGLVAGAAIAKLNAEATRRMRDAGLPPPLGLAIRIAGVLVLVILLARFPAYGFDAGFVLLAILLLALLAWLSLAPSRSAHLEEGRASGGWLGLAIIVAGGLAGYAASAWTNAMDVRIRADAQRAQDYVPPPDPLAAALPDQNSMEGSAR